LCGRGSVAGQRAAVAARSSSDLVTGLVRGLHGLLDVRPVSELPSRTGQATTSSAEPEQPEQLELGGGVDADGRLQTALYALGRRAPNCQRLQLPSVQIFLREMSRRPQ